MIFETLKNSWKSFIESQDIRYRSEVQFSYPSWLHDKIVDAVSFHALILGLCVGFLIGFLLCVVTVFV